MGEISHQLVSVLEKRKKEKAKRKLHKEKNSGGKKIKFSQDLVVLLSINER